MLITNKPFFKTTINFLKLDKKSFYYISSFTYLHSLALSQLDYTKMYTSNISHFLIDGNNCGRVAEGNLEQIQSQLTPLNPAPAKGEAIFGEGHRVTGPGADCTKGIIL